MKTQYNSTRKLSVALLLTVFVFSTTAIAQTQSIKDVTLNEYALENLIAGIKS